MHPSFVELTQVRMMDVASMEPLVSVPAHHAGLCSSQIEKSLYGDVVHVRKGVANRLLKAADYLQDVNPDYLLDVVSGYRSLEGQRRLYAEQYASIKQAHPNLSENELVERCHQFIAHPEVAGHPTGGAVDVRIVSRDRQQPLDFGSDIWDFSERSHFGNDRISYNAYFNRNMLRSVMLLAGFVPFSPEWWHFSFGDREWAFWKDEPSQYEAVPESALLD